MGVFLSLECLYAVSRARCSVRPLFRAPAVLVARLWAGQRVGSRRLKAPHIALPGYHNDSQ